MHKSYIIQKFHGNETDQNEQTLKMLTAQFEQIFVFMVFKNL